MTIHSTYTHNIQINTWQQFTEIVRSKGCNLLKCLDDFPNAILVTGCQRSGTTMLARIITQSEGMVNYWFGPDDELDAALILSGYTEPPSPGRYCFQTTYLDECYQEYYEHERKFKIIWLIRNPYSVVYSLLNNWPSRSLDGTFEDLALSQLGMIEKFVYKKMTKRIINRVQRACYIYQTKTQQLFEIFREFGKDMVFIVDYDELVLHKKIILGHIYDFIDLKFDSRYSNSIHNKSVDKKNQLSKNEIKMIHDITEPIYKKACALKNSQ